MVVEEKIKQILRGLEALYPRVLILAGGSRWRGDYRPNSDLDIYILGSFFTIYKITKSKQKLIKFKAAWPQFTLNIMLVPKFLAKRGWYCVAGESVSGKIFSSCRNRRTILGNALKLSAWYFLKSDDIIVPEEKTRWLEKGWRQLNYIEDKYSVDDKNNWRAIWKKIYFKYTPEIKFSWPNWLIYNIQFVRKGELMWLLKNPDQLVLEKIAKIIGRGGMNSAERRCLEKIVFPALFV